MSDDVREEGRQEQPWSRVASLPRSFWQRRGDASLATLRGPIRLALFTSPFIVRWAAWLVALLIVLVADLPDHNVRFEPFLLAGTFAQTAAVTFYVPLLRPLVLPGLRQRLRLGENDDVLILGLLDLVLAMVAVYLSGGWGSPYFHFALTALLIPSFFLTFRGVLALAVFYSVAYGIALASVGDGLQGSWRDTNVNSFIGAVVTPFLVALVPNYLGSLLRELDLSRQDAVEALADSDLLFRIARSFLEGGELRDVLPRIADVTREESRFDALVLLVPDDPEGAETWVYGADVPALPGSRELGRTLPADRAATWTPEALPAPLRAALAGHEWIGAVPLRSADTVEGWMVAASRERPANVLHELRLLDAVAGQVALGVRNVRLVVRIGELAAEGERTRIAREIHDGIAQMIYMLTLSLETAADRIGDDAAEQRRRLRDLTALAKNALWEVRQYIFDLRPLLSGDEGLVGAVQGQVREFQAVSELPVELAISGRPSRLPPATSASLYRIVQEGLGNIFRHARASSVEVALTFEDGTVRLSISDDGVGLDEETAAVRAGHGMENLRRRVEELRGTLGVDSTPGRGTRIDVCVPVGGEG
jgi:signal transduction histidine kinase